VADDITARLLEVAPFADGFEKVTVHRGHRPLDCPRRLIVCRCYLLLWIIVTIALSAHTSSCVWELRS
jgi:hypothetical protein